MIRGPLIAVAGALVLTGCMKDELPVPAAPRGDAQTVQLCLGAGYQDQLWFDLGTAAVVQHNPRSAWDLAFESAPGGWRVMLNGARLMSAWNIGNVDLGSVQDTIGMFNGRRIDAPSGRSDSTAIGDWRGTDAVIVIDLGVNASGFPIGQRKVRFQSVGPDGYVFSSAWLDGSDLRTTEVSKDPTRTFSYFSFGNGAVPIGPPRGEWDLVFTQYTHQFYEPYIPYLVAGALIDGTTTRVARIDGKDLDAVTLSDTLNDPFETRRNTIGYDWKTYSFETSSYTVEPGIVYIIEDADGWFYKLRFLEFYGPQGQTGCPAFEVERM